MWVTAVIGLVVVCVVLGIIGSLAAPKTNNTTTGAVVGSNPTATTAANDQAAVAVTQPTATTAAAEPTAAPVATATAAPKALGVGSTAETGGLQITLNGVRHTDKGIIPPKAGMEYVIVDITVANPGTEKKSVSSLISESAKDDTGQKYTIAFGSDAKAAAEGEVAPGDKVRGETSFEIPTTATGLVFIYDPVIGGDAVRFNLDR